jgi:PAS domain S-box-containing protein
MEFYFEKFKQVRKQLKISMVSIVEKAKINRATLWTWETGKTTPSEKKIRLLANILNISVNAISDLEPQQPVSNGKLSELANSWLTLADEDIHKRKKRESIFIEKIKQQFKELDQATIIIKALLSSMESVFYVKDTSYQYITANATFLKNVSLNSNFRVFGYSDYDFFSTNEAKRNDEQDRNIIITGKSIINEEGYILGTRKKRWGIISKIPIYDSAGNIAGLVGTFTDITERKHRDGILDLLESHMEKLGEGIVIRDNKEIHYVNKAFESIFGYPLELFTKGGINFWLNTCVHPDDRKKQEEIIYKNIRPLERTCRIIKPNGEIRRIKTKITREKYLDSDYSVSIIRDITDIKDQTVSPIINSE